MKKTKRKGESGREFKRREKLKIYSAWQNYVRMEIFQRNEGGKDKSRRFKRVRWMFNISSAENGLRYEF